jgi:short-subunit dehydrogenase
MPLKETPGYSGSKFALRGFMLALNLAVKKHGIHVTALYPTAIDTPMLLKEAITGGSPLNFFSAPLKPDDVANAVEKAIMKKKAEIALPGIAGTFCKFMSFFPKQIPLMTKLIEPLANINLKKYMEKNKVILERMKSELGI